MKKILYSIIFTNLLISSTYPMFKKTAPRRLSQSTANILSSFAEGFSGGSRNSEWRAGMLTVGTGVLVALKQNKDALDANTKAVQEQRDMFAQQAQVQKDMFERMSDSQQKMLEMQKSMLELQQLLVGLSEKHKAYLANILLSERSQEQKQNDITELLCKAAGVTPASSKGAWNSAKGVYNDLDTAFKMVAMAGFVVQHGSAFIAQLNK